MLSKDQILSNVKLKTETVNVPEWDGDVIVSEMNGAGRDAFEQAITEKDKAGRLINPRAKLIAATVVDEKGDLLFSQDDLSAIGKLSYKVIDRICEVAQRLNGMRDVDVEIAKGN